VRLRDSKVGVPAIVRHIENGSAGFVFAAIVSLFPKKQKSRRKCPRPKTVFRFSAALNTPVFMADEVDADYLFAMLHVAGFPRKSMRAS
jgi:hypothetical protein